MLFLSWTYLTSICSFISLCIRLHTHGTASKRKLVSVQWLRPVSRVCPPHTLSHSAQLNPLHRLVTQCFTAPRLFLKVLPSSLPVRSHMPSGWGQRGPDDVTVQLFPEFIPLGSHGSGPWRGIHERRGHRYATIFIGATIATKWWLQKKMHVFK